MEVTIHREFGVPVSAVWRLLTRFERVPKWVGVEEVTLEGEGVGRIRTLRFPGGEKLIERLDALNETTHSMRLSLTFEGSQIPWKDSQLAMIVAEKDAGRCVIECVVTCDPAGVEESRAQRMVKGIYNGFMNAIEDEAVEELSQESAPT